MYNKTIIKKKYFVFLGKGKLDKTRVKKPASI